MTAYKPRYAGSVTKYVFVESPEMTPSDLAIRAYEISQGVMIKETCFGLQITGKEEDVERNHRISSGHSTRPTSS